jgi:prephenate dehydratase
MRVAYLGPRGTFSEEAAAAAEGAELVATATIADAILAVAAGDADRAVVPIENSVEGPVGVTLDTLAAHPEVTIVAEQVLAVSLCLVGHAGVATGDLTRVLSHPQPLGQCARWLRERLPGAETVPVRSTAEAVRLVAAEPGAPCAAVGTRRAADLYGVAVLAEAIEDEPGNATRFVWVAPVGTEPGAGAAKTSLVFWGEGDDSPGWLVRCLSEFAFRGVNLSKIESRPLRGRLGHYRFFVDCEGAAESGAVAQALDGLRARCEEVLVLGTYPRAAAVD